MFLRHLAGNTALMMTICVLAMLLHPLAQGPYSAVHGPASALRARYKSWAMLAGVVSNSFRVTSRLVHRALAVLTRPFVASSSVALFLPESQPDTLRC